MRHATEAELALLAGGDLGFFRRWLLRAHTRNCERCRGEMGAFVRSRERAMQDAGDLPPGVDWESLSVEMTANIRVGLEAGECVGPVRPRARRWRIDWNLGTALVAAALLLAAGLALNFPRDEANRLGSALVTLVHGRGRSVGGAIAATPEGVFLEASPSGPSVNENGAALKLLAPVASGAVTVSVSLQDSVGARYVDSDSGQVTINKVYYEQ